MIKRFTQTLFAFMAIMSVEALAQPTLQSANIPNVGDIWAYKTITDTTIQPGLTGMGVTWNYQSYFVNPTVFNQIHSPLGSSPDDALFPNANMKVSSSFGGSEYYLRSNGALQFLGYKNLTSDIVITNTQNLLTVPLSYGQSVSNVPVTGTSFGSFNVTGTISATADATGTLQLSTGSTSNTTRVFYNINLIAGGDIGLDTYIQIRRYCWYRTGQRAPIFIIESLSVTGNLANSYQKSVLVNTITPTGIDDAGALSFSMSPNPVTSKAVITVAGERAQNVSFSVMDITGRVWKSSNVQPDMNHSFTLDVADLPKGVYILSLQTSGTRRQQRFVVE